MSLSQRIQQIWATSTYPAPKIPLIFYQGELLATVEDDKPFLRFMSSDGQIFVSLHQNCQLQPMAPNTGDYSYSCVKVDPILCGPTSGPESYRDLFVLNNICPLLA